MVKKWPVDINQNVIGLNLEDLRNIPRYYDSSLRDSKGRGNSSSALESDLLNTLVTTDTIAEGLLG